MALKDDVAQFLEQPAMRWAIVGFGVLILLRLKLIMFAAALPVVAYWHYSQQQDPDDAGGEGEQASGEQEDMGDEDEDMGDYGAGPKATRRAGWADQEEDDEGFMARSAKANGQQGDPYNSSFWGADGVGDGSARRGSTPSQQRKPKESDGLDLGFDDDDFGLGGPSKGGKPKDPLGDFGLDKGGGLDDFDFGLGSKSGGGGGSKMGGVGDDLDFDFGLGSGGGDMDFLGGFGGGFGGGCGGGGKGKGKGKDGKGKGKDGKGKDGPREADPRQVFVSGVGDMPEDEIRAFFEEVGEVDRLKVLMTPEGTSKGVCFVTFRSEDQAQQALALSGQCIEAGGRPIRVSLAHGGNKGDKGDKGGGKGPRPDGMGSSRFGGDRDMDDLPDFGGSERFGSAFGDRREKGGKKGKGDKSGGKGGRGGGRGELDDLLEDLLVEADGPVRLGDFDFAARRFLTELLSRDRSDGTNRFQEAMDMVIKYTSSKDRSSVRKWPAYIFTLLQKFDPNLWEELRERDAERRREKGGGGSLGGFGRRDFSREDRDENDVDRARRFAPDEKDTSRQVLDRWGKPVILDD